MKAADQFPASAASRYNTWLMPLKVVCHDLRALGDDLFLVGS